MSRDLDAEDKQNKIDFKELMKSPRSDYYFLAGIIIIIIVAFFIRTEFKSENIALLESLNQTLHRFEVAELNNARDLNKKIVENQHIIIFLANRSLANQDNITYHFDHITDQLIFLTNLSQTNSAKNLNLTKFNRAAIIHSDEILKQLAQKFNITVAVFNSSKF